MGDIQIDGEWAETWQRIPHLIRLDNDWGIAVFGTNNNMEIIERWSNIYIDGTFRSAPQPYVQLLTVHGEVNGRVVHCASALMAEKTIASYRQVFQTLKLKVREVTRNNNWQPRYGITDFELALITAFETEFPRARIRGCYFHFSQSL